MQLAILSSYHLPTIRLCLENRFNQRFTVDPGESCGQLTSQLCLRNLNAAADTHP